MRANFTSFSPPVGNDEAPEPPYLPDVASYELAYATVRAGQREEAAASRRRQRAPSAVTPMPCCCVAPTTSGRSWRGGLVTAGPERRETLIAVAMLPGTDEPLVSELSADLFAFSKCSTNSPIRPFSRTCPELDSLIADLAGARAHRGASVRICIIGKFPPIQGGVSARTYWGAHDLAARGHEVHVVTNAKEVRPPFRMHMRRQDWKRCEATYEAPPAL